LDRKRITAKVANETLYVDREPIINWWLRKVIAIAGSGVSEAETFNI
jgi:hypothetical protein